MNRRNGTWVVNLRQKLEDMCTDIDEFVSKEPVSFVGNQMETVGANVRSFFSGFVDEFGFTQEVDRSKSVHSVETFRKNVVCKTNTNNLKEAYSGQITSGIGQHLVNERGGLLNKTSDNDTHVNNNRFEDRVFYDESFHSDATGFEYSDWGIENILDLELNIDNNMIEEEPLTNLEEKKTDLNSEMKFDLNTSITHQSSELESSVTCNKNEGEKSEFDLSTSITHQSSELKSSVTCNENQEENAEYIIAGGLLFEELYESLNSSIENFTFKPDHCKPTETVDDFSVASDALTRCGSFTTLAYDSNNEADVSCSGTDGVTVDFEDAKKGAVDGSVISGKHSSFPKTSRSKSYKKMIQDAFMSRKRLTKEYKQLAILYGDILYGDIDKELCQPTESESSKLPPVQVQVQDGPDSEWELL